MPPKDDEELQSAAIDVAYEFKLFREAHQRYFLNTRPVGSPGLGHNNSMADMPLMLSANQTALPSQDSTDHLNRDALLIHVRI
jgi:hypothetical protein